MSDPRTTLGLVERIYAAAYDPAGWRDYAEELRRATDATSAHFLLIDPGHEQACIFAELTGTPEQHREYEAHFWRVDKWRDIAARSSAGAVWGSHQLGPEKEFAESEFYRDFLRRWNGDLFYFGGGVVYRRAGLEVASGVMRDRATGPVGEAELHLMRALMPHLQRAFAMHRRFSRLRLERNTLAAVLDRAPFGVIVLDAEGRVAAMNAAAERLVADGDGLTHRAGRLQPARETSAEAFEAVLRRGGVLALPRRSGKRPLGLLAAPAPRDGRAFGKSAPATILLLSDPEERAAAPAQALRQLFGLTGGEARLVARLVDGRTVEQAAEDLSISVNTA
jgi:PAS domain-containing protein